ncbi:syntaxin-112-like [Diospyros lotus]|uniref:syntaxin-112-like n=1 Tax=Diospyros lotus TaxID=55363 RepID=UPI00224DB903|nr:syntaxin-112-like [Diospyros lotus]
MNDLMTKSFLSYVELKKQAMKDLEAGPDIETGQLDPADERNLSQFFEEVAAVKADMEEITSLLLDLQDLNKETKSTHSAKVLRGLRDRIRSDMVTVLRKARIIKTRLELLDQSNVENRRIHREGSPIDRTRMSVTNGLRIKLRNMMNDFQSLRKKIGPEHREPGEEVIEEMVKNGDLEGKKTDLVMENEETEKSLKEIRRSLAELHQIFLDMAVLVETQGEKINDVEENVAIGRAYTGSGTKELVQAGKMEKKRKWACWIGIVFLVLFLACLVLVLT